MNGFFVRVAAQADKAARDIEKIADEVDNVGLGQDAQLLRKVAAHLRVLGRAAAARDAGIVTYDRIADDTDYAYRAVSQCALQLRVALLLPQSFELEGVAKVLAKLNHDALADTQPISRPPKLDDED